MKGKLIRIDEETHDDSEKQYDAHQKHHDEELSSPVVWLLRQMAHLSNRPHQITTTRRTKETSSLLRFDRRNRNTPATAVATTKALTRMACPFGSAILCPRKATS